MGGDLYPPSGGGQRLNGVGFARDSRHFRENIKFEKNHDFKGFFSSLDLWISFIYDLRSSEMIIFFKNQWIKRSIARSAEKKIKDGGEQNFRWGGTAKNVDGEGQALMVGDSALMGWGGVPPIPPPLLKTLSTE